jgi:flagellar protein FliO/FliZ
VVALAAVLALIVAAGWVMKRLIDRGIIPGGAAALGLNRSQRLAIVEVRPIDLRHRLVLVRRDDVEHLLLLGAPGDLVIETGIRPRPPSPPDEAPP